MGILQGDLGYVLGIGQARLDRRRQVRLRCVFGCSVVEVMMSTASGLAQRRQNLRGALLHSAGRVVHLSDSNCGSCSVPLRMS